MVGGEWVRDTYTDSWILENVGMSFENDEWETEYTWPKRTPSMGVGSSVSELSLEEIAGDTERYLTRTRTIFKLWPGLTTSMLGGRITIMGCVTKDCQTELHVVQEGRVEELGCSPEETLYLVGDLAVLLGEEVSSRVWVGRGGAELAIFRGKDRYNREYTGVVTTRLGGYVEDSGDMERVQWLESNAGVLALRLNDKSMAVWRVREGSVIGRWR